MPRRTRAGIVAALGLTLGVAMAGCAAEAPPTDSVVTFEVAGGSRFKVLLTDPDDIRIVKALADGEDAPSIPNGLIVPESGVNTDWSWSLDPEDFDFVDVVDGTCDGAPEDIEDGTHESDRFCPWSAIVIEMVPAE